MLSYKEWKLHNESFDFSLGLSTPKTVGVMGGVASFEELLEAKKKAMKKKMDFGGKEEDEESEDEEEDYDDEDEDEDDAETGDGEVVEPSSDKDSNDDDMSDDGEEEQEDGEMNPALMRMKKKMGKMKKKMCAKTKKKDKPKSEATEQDDAWWQSVHDMMGKPKDRNFDGLNYVDGIQEGWMHPDLRSPVSDSRGPNIEAIQGHVRNMMAQNPGHDPVVGMNNIAANSNTHGMSQYSDSPEQPLPFKLLSMLKSWGFGNQEQFYNWWHDRGGKQMVMKMRDQFTPQSQY